MKSETGSRKIKKYTAYRLVFPTVILVVLVTVFISGIYYLLNDYTTDMVTSYLEELVAHDKANIQDFVTDRFTMMRMLHNELNARQPEDLAALLEEMEIQADVHNMEAILLMDDADNLYSCRQGFVSKEDNPFVQYFADSAENTVAGRFKLEKDYMLYGLSFSDDPLCFGENSPRFTRMILLRDVRFIQKKMRITSFDGRGYTSIVDQNGNFVVFHESIASADQVSNCFELIEGCPIWGVSREEIPRKFQSGEPFTFWYTDANGVTKFVLFSPSEISNWTFVTAIEKSVYTDQSQRFVRLVAFLMGGLFLIFLVFMFLFRLTRKKLNAFYSSVVEGAHSRQYYDERVVDDPVTALAVVDIDHLKGINDTYGHLMGDEAIREMATVLVSRTGDLGKVCRFGGDEFIIAFQEPITGQEFRAVIDGIMADTRAIRLKGSAGVPLSLSIGAQYEEGIASDIFVKADALLYEAKKTRNQAVVCIPGSEE